MLEEDVKKTLLDVTNSIHDCRTVLGTDEKVKEDAPEDVKELMDEMISRVIRSCHDASLGVDGDGPFNNPLKVGLPESIGMHNQHIFK